MKVLHTSDWHLGSVLYGRKRYEEYEQFLEWLIDRIRDEDIDVLLIAGDIFDNSAPSNRAQEMYYYFLNQVAAIPGLQVVVTGGNHDSPSLLNAPKPLLRQLRIHVIGAITSDVTEEILLLHSKDGSQSLIVCAVPYLRDRDIRTAEPGESSEDKITKIQDGIRDHYQQVWGEANKIRKDYGLSIPVIAMGHLHLSGCKVTSDDRVRDLYIGNLEGVAPDTILCGFNYLALGHLHQHNKVGGNLWCRYSGSPLPMGFGEAGQEKKIVVIDFQENGERSVEEISVPCFRKLLKIRGDISSVEAVIQNLVNKGENIWIDVMVESEFNADSIQNRLHELARNTSVEILKIENEALTRRAFRAMEEGEHLGDLDETEVFIRCLDENEIPDEEKGDLISLFREILVTVQEDDRYAE
jgi:DNA repair protein SbcD/Mre11